jgi:hypothetical protein
MRSVLWVLLLGLTSVSCRSPHSAFQSPQPAEETIALYSSPVDPPHPIYVGHVATTNSLDRDLPIRVLVMGNVVRPGWLTIPKGTTALGAIRRAGGFSWGSSNVLFIKRGGQKYKYSLVWEPLAPELDYRIWYGENGAPSDFLLEAGDALTVPSGL